MTTTAHSVAFSPFPALDGGEGAGMRASVSGQAVCREFDYAGINAPDVIQPKSPETLRHRHQIQAKQTRARRVIHHRRAK